MFLCEFRYCIENVRAENALLAEERAKVALAAERADYAKNAFEWECLMRFGGCSVKNPKGTTKCETCDRARPSFEEYRRRNGDDDFPGVAGGRGMFGFLDSD